MARPRGFERLLVDVESSIARHREQSGMSQEAAATRASIDYKRWQRIESGSVNITMRTLHRVARALGLDPRDLLG